MKKIFYLVPIIIICVCALVEWHKKTEIIKEETLKYEPLYVLGPDGNWVEYAYSEKNDDYDPNEDESDYMTNFFDEYVKDKYCYAHYAPHGDLWQIHCHNTNELCMRELNKDLKDFMTLDTKKCYRPFLTKAWCISSVKTGLYRYYDDETYGEILTGVCTQGKSLCEKIQQYRFNNRALCHEQVVLSNKNEISYLWSDEEVKKLIKQNQTAKPLVFKE